MRLKHEYGSRICLELNCNIYVGWCFRVWNVPTNNVEYLQEHSNIKLKGIKIFDDDCGDKFWYDISLPHTKENV